VVAKFAVGEIPRQKTKHDQGAEQGPHLRIGIDKKNAFLAALLSGQALL
jgi:hypothetical protein